MMATPLASDVEEAKNVILRDGFFSAPDNALGDRVLKMDKDGTLLASVAGLQFFKDNVLDNPRIAPVLESFFDWFGFGLYRSIGHFPGPFTFGGGDPYSPPTYLLVQIWEKASVIKYWPRAHRELLETVQAENGLLRVIPACLSRLGLDFKTITFKDGGFSILDGRMAFEIVKGSAITCAFGTKAQIEDWTPMLLPQLPDIEKIVADMESSKFGINKKFFSIGKSPA